MMLSSSARNMRSKAVPPFQIVFSSFILQLPAFFPAPLVGVWYESSSEQRGAEGRKSKPRKAGDFRGRMAGYQKRLTCVKASMLKVYQIENQKSITGADRGSKL